MNLKVYRFIVAALVFFLVSTASAEILNGKVAQVHDGDTVILEDGDDNYSIRFFGIDAPESDQPGGQSAKEFVKSRIFNRPVTVYVRDEDMYGRRVGEVFFEGESINRLLVKNGHAWFNRRYARDDQDLESLEATAKATKIGLWSQSHPIAPWSWRRGVRAIASSEGHAASSESLEKPYPGLSGADLRRALARDFQPTERHTYEEAREYMWREVDDNNGFVTLVYSGNTYKPKTPLDHNEANTEHTWPQSKFGNSSMLKADIFHLYPTWSGINGTRGSHPFADIPDEETERWWNSSQASYPVPGPDTIDHYSEYADGRFEPREDHKGNVARSMFYVYAVYGGSGLNLSWFQPQIETLIRWHKADPVDEAERLRDEKIALYQGNHNPFIVLGPEILERAK